MIALVASDVEVMLFFQHKETGVCNQPYTLGFYSFFWPKQ